MVLVIPSWYNDIPGAVYDLETVPVSAAGSAVSTGTRTIRPLKLVDGLFESVLEFVIHVLERKASFLSCRTPQRHANSGGDILRPL